MLCNKSFKHTQTQQLKMFISCSWGRGRGLGFWWSQLSLAVLCSLGPGLFHMSPHPPWPSSFLEHPHFMADHQRAKGRPNNTSTFKAFAGIIPAHIPLTKASHRVKPKVSGAGELNSPRGRGLNNTTVSQLSSLKALCYGLNCVPPKFICCSLTPQSLRMWLHWEILPLKRWLSWNEAIKGALIQTGWCPYKRRKFRHIEERPCEDTARGRPSVSQGERPQKKPNLPTPWSWATSF